MPSTMQPSELFFQIPAFLLIVVVSVVVGRIARAARSRWRARGKR
jgi:hypothetical protein